LPGRHPVLVAKQLLSMAWLAPATCSSTCSPTPVSPRRSRATRWHSPYSLRATAPGTPAAHPRADRPTPRRAPARRHDKERTRSDERRHYVEVPDSRPRRADSTCSPTHSRSSKPLRGRVVHCVFPAQSRQRYRLPGLNPTVCHGRSRAGNDRKLPSPRQRTCPEVPIDPCRGEPFRAENGARPPVDVVVAWSLEAVQKSGAGSCAVGRCVCFEHEDQICRSLQLLRVTAPR
jgi:hypothetical protein